VSDPGERDRPGRLRQGVVLGVVAVVAAGAVAISLTNDDSSADPPAAGSGQPDAPGGGQESTTSQDVGVRDRLAVDVLAQQERAVARGNQADYLATWDGDLGSSQRQAESTYTNLRALGVRRFDTRYVAADVGGLSSADQRRIGDTGWTAEVDVAWRLAGIDRADAHSTLTFTFVQRDDEATVVSIDRASGNREPIWLLGHLEVRRSARTLVAAVSEREADRVSSALKQAAIDVSAVVPRWHGDLVAFVPGDASQLEAILAAAPGSYDGIAAVTTTVDGSRQRSAPVAIVVNPDVFDRLGPIGSHVVITHESTHMATGAATVTMPLWVAEGFADYVGVGAVDVPINVSAAALLQQIKQNGLPGKLPDNAAFSGTQGNLEVAYEEAWLAARLIARDYGQRALVAFYEDVRDHPADVRDALHDRLHLSIGAFTADWRAYLQDVARAQ
jgi:hypothetical protein